MADLFYVIGASGVGKDSLLDYVRQHLPLEAPVMFAHRYITRSADAGYENHIAVSEEEFQRQLDQGCLAMHWDSHGYRYGIGIEINQWLAKGINVVMNGSRGYLSRAAWDYPELRPVLIRVETATLRQRLEQRGRETAAEIEKRLERAIEFDKIEHPHMIVINNDGDLSLAGKQLTNLVVGSAIQCA
ncbi:MAG: phosphonate metabolism protein/1,5-bisphosphokinase (PRPP-forming) PhnN [Gammaproteobacteria bacterium]|nr:phosphonate metabolism protein/1,5-bisphosphokinase (PRPP-forming) PhnN [Gammaproteobacteria bacterium]